MASVDARGPTVLECGGGTDVRRDDGRGPAAHPRDRMEGRKEAAEDASDNTEKNAPASSSLTGEGERQRNRVDGGCTGAPSGYEREAEDHHQCRGRRR